jgi:hypothetical protein
MQFRAFFKFPGIFSTTSSLILPSWLAERHLESSPFHPAVNVLFKARGHFAASTFLGPLGVLCWLFCALFDFSVSPDDGVINKFKLNFCAFVLFCNNWHQSALDYTTVMMRFFAFVALFALLIPSLARQYSLADSYQGANFFSAFQFFTGADPTHGRVYELFSLLILSTL